ncbi:unnamed protein product [Symbiodinium sp. CCMP2592]|nr:unnamed protein product [Symbiodinium sp. CCMP2592]
MASKILNVCGLKVALQSPWQIFKAGLGWSAGFVGCLVTLQTVTLQMVEKSAVHEVMIWLIIFSPCVLAIMGPCWLMQITCQKQLADLFLRRGVMLLHPTSPSVNIWLMTTLSTYGCAAILSVSYTGREAVLVVIVALLGPSWALVKALSVARETAEQMSYLQCRKVKLGSLSSELPKLRELAWHEFLICARKEDFEFMTSPQPERASDFSHWDLLWHRRCLWQLGGSISGFLILPCFAAMMSSFIVISFVHGTRYACSVGCISNLELASKLHMLNFTAHQSKYMVHVDMSFKEMAILAAADVPWTRWISLQQPETEEGSETPYEQELKEDKSFGIEQILLSKALIPRVSSVKVQGLRSSLSPAEYLVRFAPMQTLPSAVTIRSGNYTASVPWSMLPGSIVSVPAGADMLKLEIFLLDFYLDLPAKVDLSPPPEIQQWTAFKASSNASDAFCGEFCRAHPNCLAAFLGHRGCFYAFHQAQAPQSLMLAQGRMVSGVLEGCRLSETSNCNEVLAEENVLQFDNLVADWQSSTAQLKLNLILEVGGQRFISDSGSLSLRQGAPIVSDSFALLLHGAVILNASVTVNSGDVVILVDEYDPVDMGTLNLVVLPMLPDMAFKVQWTSEHTEADKESLQLFRRHGPCAASAMAFHRYTLCSVQGILPDVPVSTAVSPWQGKMKQPLEFTATVRGGEKSQGQGSWQAPLQKVELQFRGVDSPAAWAAQRGCSILDLPLANKSVVASADASCRLLAECPRRLCKLVDEEGLGKGSLLFNGRWWAKGTSLAPRSIVKIMGCLQQSPCNMTYSWEHRGEKLHLTDHGAEVPISTLLEEAQRTEPGLNLLRHMHIIAPDETNFQERCAKAFWAIPTFSVALLQIIASWYKDMPKLLLQEMMLAPRLPLINARQQHLLQTYFQHVHELEMSMNDPKQFRQVGAVLDVGGNVTRLQVSCAACGSSDRQVLPQDMQHILRHMPRLDLLVLQNMKLSAALLGTALSAAPALNGLALEWLELVPKTAQIGTVLQQLPRPERLHDLHLRANGLDKRDTWVASLPQQFTRLDRVLLWHNQLSDDIGLALARNVAAYNRRWKRFGVSSSGFNQSVISQIEAACACECE